MERNSIIAKLAIGTLVFAVYEMFGFEGAVILSLVIIIMTVGEIANQMQSDNPPTADDLK